MDKFKFKPFAYLRTHLFFFRQNKIITMKSEFYAVFSFSGPMDYHLQKIRVSSIIIGVHKQ